MKEMWLYAYEKCIWEMNYEKWALTYEECIWGMDYKEWAPVAFQQLLSVKGSIFDPSLVHMNILIWMLPDYPEDLERTR